MSVETSKAAVDGVDEVDLSRIGQRVVDMTVKHLKTDTIPAQLETAGSKCFPTLKYLEHTVESLSEVYILLNQEAQDDKAPSTRLALWLTDKLVDVLAARHCRPLHDKVLDILASLLRLLAYRDAPTFDAIVADLLGVLSHLQTGIESLVGSKAGADVFPVFLTTFTDLVNRTSSLDPPLDLPDICLHKLNDFAAFVHLQTAIISVFAFLVASSLPFQPSWLEQLWSTALDMLGRGHVNSKAGLLELVEMLIKRKNTCTLTGYSATRLGLTLIELCFRSRKNAGLMDESVRLGYEKTLASCMDLIIVKSQCNSDHNLLLKSLCRSLVSGTFMCVDSKQLIKALMASLCSLSTSVTLRSVNVSSCSLALFKYLDQTDYQVGVACLVKFLMHEIFTIPSSYFPAQGPVIAPNQTPRKAKRMKLSRRSIGSQIQSDQDGEGEDVVKRKKCAKLEWSSPALDQMAEATSDLCIAIESILKSGLASSDLISKVSKLSGMIQMTVQFMAMARPNLAAGRKPVKLPALTDSNVLTYCRLWTSVLERGVTGTGTGTGTGTLSSADLIGVLWQMFIGLDAVVFACEMEKFQSSTLDALLRVSMIPWLGFIQNVKETTTGDFKPMERDLRLSTQLINALREGKQQQEAVSIWVQSLYAVAAFPSDYSLQIRESVLRSCLDCSLSDVRSSAIRCLLVFAGLAAKTRNTVLELVKFCTHDENLDVQRQLAHSLGLLALIMADGVTPVRKISPHKDQIRLCDSIVLEPKEIKCAVDPHLFEAFFDMGRRESDPSVRLAFLGSLPTVMKCLDLQQSSARPILEWCVQSLGSLASDELVPLGDTIEIILEKTSDESVSESFASKLKSELSLAGANRNRQRENILLTLLGRIGLKSSGNCLVKCLTWLLDMCLFHTVSFVKATAFCEVRRIIEASGLDGTRFFVGHQQPLCAYICSVLHNIHDSVLQQPSDIECRSALDELASLFGFSDAKRMVESQQKHLLPRLVCHHFDLAPAILPLLSGVLNVDRPQLVFNNSRYIFSYFVRTGDGSHVDELLKFLETETKFDLDSVLRAYAPHTYQELLLHISECPDKIFHGLVLLNGYDPEAPAMPLKSVTDLPPFIQSHIIGLLAFFNTLLVAKSTEACLALRSLIHIMDLIGPEYLSQYRVKVIGILRQSMTLTDAIPVELCLKSWYSFVRNIETASLGSMLSEITISLLPLLDRHPDRLAEIFNYLFVDQRDTLRSHFQDIVYIPRHPALSEVRRVLEECQDSQHSLSAQVAHLLKGCRHERDDVRRYAAVSLLDVLRNNRHELVGWISSSETLSAAICDAVGTILCGTQDRDSAASLAFAECVGLIGAIDPGRLSKIGRSGGAKEVRLAGDGVRSTDFAVKLIGELVRAYQAASDPTIQDCCAYTLQEVLKTYGCAANRDGPGKGAKIWQALPDDFQELLKPYLQSHFKPKEPVVVRDVRIPIYGSSRCKSFNSWIVWWLFHLTGCLDPTATDLRNLFESCSLTYKHTIDVGLFLLPYLVTEVIFEGRSDVTAKIKDEIMAVVNYAHDHDILSSPKDFRRKSTQTALSLYDSLIQINRHWRNRLNVAKDHAARQILTGDADMSTLEERCRLLDDFLASVPKEAMGFAAFKCKAFSSSLRLFDAFARENPSRLEEHVLTMQRVYAALEDTDGFVGLSAVCSVQMSLIDQALESEMKGNLDEALKCYGVAIEKDINIARNHEGLVQTWLRLGESGSALSHLDRILAKRTQWTKDFNKLRVEACLQLGEWDSLQQYAALEPYSSSDWSVGAGRLLLSIKAGADGEFYKRLRMIREGCARGLTAVASDSSWSYERGYDCVAQLHLLQDVEDAAREVFFASETNLNRGRIMEKLQGEWNRRLELTEMSFRVREPILRLHRAVFHLLPPREVAAEKLERESWLTSARIARKAGHVALASSCLLKSELQQLPEVWLEKAKCLWSQGKTKEALVFLQERLKKEPEVILVDEKQPSARAKAMLLVGRWMEATALCETNTIIRQYRELMKQHGNWESSHFFLAKYYDRIMAALEESEPGKEQECLPMIVRHYGNSLLHGNQYIYQSMPRLLTSWLDYGAKVHEASKRGGNTARYQQSSTLLKSLNDVVKDLVQRLAPYQFFTAFSQIVSRICHPLSAVHEILIQLLAKLVATYPQQAIWMMLAVYKSSHRPSSLLKSSHHLRNRRCKEVFSHAELLNPSVKKLLKDILGLADKLVELSEKEFPKGTRQVPMDSEFRSLVRLVKDASFSQVFVPDKVAMNITLPTSSVPHDDHHPFPHDLPHIVDFGPTVEILSSLARPKKIVIRGSDGRRYPILCKPKDDLRKDGRLMEFNALVNRCLYQDAESRRRNLGIQTYTVVPLTDSCGLIGWLDDTVPTRTVLNKLYKESGRLMSLTTVRRLWAPIETNPQAPMDVKRRIFQNLLKHHQPPVLHEWFLRTFPEPSSWYQSRLNFSRTLAVMSMVGAVLGLGDRHMENILLDSKTGDLVHVDFDCLFNKGDTFTFPEKVPFRLTHNLVDALGCTGVEGPFRLACEATMRVLREQKDSLVSVFSSMIHDPLVEWQPQAGKDQRPRASPQEMAMKKLEEVEQNLQALMPYNRGMPLSVEGQVHYLIRQATDQDNLARMYVGWAPYL